jgi:hypothetical protein
MAPTAMTIESKVWMFFLMIGIPLKKRWQIAPKTRMIRDQPSGNNLFGTGFEYCDSMVDNSRKSMNKVKSA